MIVIPCPVCPMSVEVYLGQINKKYSTKFKIPVVYYYSQLMAVACGDSTKEAGLDGNVIRLHSSRPVCPITVPVATRAACNENLFFRKPSRPGKAPRRAASSPTVLRTRAHWGRAVPTGSIAITAATTRARIRRVLAYKLGQVGSERNYFSISKPVGSFDKKARVCRLPYCLGGTRPPSSQMPGPHASRVHSQVSRVARPRSEFEALEETFERTIDLPRIL